MKITPTNRKDRENQRGIALVFTLFAIATLVIGATSALTISSGDIHASRNFRGAAQANLAAESALMRGVQASNTFGIRDFSADVVGQWGTLMPTGWSNFGGKGYQYQVIPTADAVDPVNLGILTASATGPEGERSLMVAAVNRVVIPLESPGVIYMANDDPTESTFNGNSFSIDGNDHDYNGGPGPEDPLPGLATRNDTNTQEILDSLNGSQLDNIEGLGFQAGPPTVPAVQTSPFAPTIDHLNQLVLDLLALPHVTVTDKKLTGNATWGDSTTPQITHVDPDTGDFVIRGNGNASGAGILIIDGDFTLQGTLDFLGLIIVRGETTVDYDAETGISGNGTIFGSLWTQHLDLNVAGSMVANFSSNALDLAGQAAGGMLVTGTMEVTALVDCSQVASGVVGCP